jgi:hypothetical protein
MHGHGDKPYLCAYDGCERAAAGNGFPRQWNLRDHMRRVHHDDGASLQSMAAPSPPASGTNVSKNRKKGTKKTSLKASSAKSVKTTEYLNKFQEHQKALSEIVSGFAHPDDPKIIQHMDSAESHLSALRNISDMMSGQGSYLPSYHHDMD